MPKRKLRSKVGKQKVARIEELLLKSEDIAGLTDFEDELDESKDSSIALPQSSSSSSESSIDSALQKKILKKFKKRASSAESARKYYRLFKQDMELFQRNVDIKLNYLESLVQSLIQTVSKNSQSVSTAAKPVTISNNLSSAVKLPSSSRNMVISEVRSIQKIPELKPKGLTMRLEDQLEFLHVIGVNDEKTLEINEKKFLSNTTEDIQFRNKLALQLSPHLSPRQSYTKSENSIVASLLLTYFEENFLLQHIGWGSGNGRLSLSDKPGHIHFFYVTINNSYPNSFKGTIELKRGIALVLKRLREKYRRKLSQTVVIEYKSIPATISSDDHQETNSS